MPSEIGPYAQLLSGPIGAVFLALLGACWGSFAATVTDRWPAGGSILAPRSHCASCGRTLGILDLVPLASFVLARGRCRTCNTPIPWRYPLIELGSAGLAVLAAMLAPGPDAFWLVLLGWQLFLLAILDAEHFWLPNALTAALALTGLGHAFATGAAQWPEAVLGGAVGFGSLYVIAAAYKRVRHRTGLGGGDPKLLGAIGFWASWRLLPVILLTAALIGIAVAALMVIRDRNRHGIMTRRLPFGTCLALSAWLWMLAESVNGAVTPWLLGLSPN